MAVTPPAPSDGEGLLIHQRLIRGDLLASTDLAVAYLDPLTDWLIGHNRAVDPDLCAEAAGDALLALIKNPQSYQPDQLHLEAYLRMSASGDLKNILKRENRHISGRRSLESVELSPDEGKYLGQDDDPSLPLQMAEEIEIARASIPASVWDGLGESEKGVLELMLQGERRTSAYARVCGIEHLPIDEQRSEVKRVRDRLQKRLERAGSDDEQES
jgi:RNA polymerase sigma-70 factor, ECF subfamily